MRYLLAIALVATALAGCNEAQQPTQSTEVSIPPRSGELGAVTPTEPGPYEPSAVVPVDPEPVPDTSWTTVPTPEPTPDPAPMTDGTYTVQKGDTLWSVAKRLYGDGQRWKDIVAMNPGLKPEAMRVGQAIKVPAN